MIKVITPIDNDLSDRMLLSLVFEVTQLADDAEHINNCLLNIMRQRGLVKEAEAA